MLEPDANLEELLRSVPRLVIAKRIDRASARGDWAATQLIAQAHATAPAPKPKLDLSVYTSAELELYKLLGGKQTSGSRAPIQIPRALLLRLLDADMWRSHAMYAAGDDFRFRDALIEALNLPHGDVDSELGGTVEEVN